MSLLDSVVTVTITTATVSVSQAGFGVPLIAAYFLPAIFPERVRSYTSVNDMVTDGFATTDAAYRAANAIFSQNPKIPTLKIGRRALAPTQLIHGTPVEPAVAAVRIYTATINGTAFAFTTDATPTVAEIVAGVVGLINLGAEPMTAADVGTTHMTLTADVPGDVNTVVLSDDSDGEDLWTYKDESVDPGIATDLGNIELEDSDWYGLVIDNQSEDEILAAAAWVESNLKLFCCSTMDTDVTTTSTTDIASDLKAAAYARTSISYHHLVYQFMGAAWMGRMFPSDPGTSTWNAQTLAGVTVTPGSILSSTVIGKLEGKYCNYYVEIGGVNVTREGKVSDNEWIDVVRGVDWTRARIQENVWSILVNRSAALSKVPFTDSGIAAVQGQIQAPLLQGESRGLYVQGESLVTVPKAADVATASKLLRLLPDMDFSAVLAGAIHEVSVTGVVSV